MNVSFVNGVCYHEENTIRGNAFNDQFVISLIRDDFNGFEFV